MNILTCLGQNCFPLTHDKKRETLISAAGAKLHFHDELKLAPAQQLIIIIIIINYYYNYVTRRARLEIHKKKIAESTSSFRSYLSQSYKMRTWGAVATLAITTLLALQLSEGT